MESSYSQRKSWSEDCGFLSFQTRMCRFRNLLQQSLQRKTAKKKDFVMIIIQMEDFCSNASKQNTTDYQWFTNQKRVVLKRFCSCCNSKKTSLQCVTYWTTISYCVNKFLCSKNCDFQKIKKQKKENTSRKHSWNIHRRTGRKETSFRENGEKEKRWRGGVGLRMKWAILFRPFAVSLKSNPLIRKRRLRNYKQRKRAWTLKDLAPVFTHLFLFTETR